MLLSPARRSSATLTPESSACACARSFPGSFSASKLVFAPYHYLISPALHLMAGAGAGCRFEPSCSHYAEEAIEQYGLIAGTWLGFKRLLRCNPFSQGGLDPVPPRAISPELNLQRKK